MTCTYHILNSIRVVPIATPTHDDVGISTVSGMRVDAGADVDVDVDAMLDVMMSRNGPLARRVFGCNTSVLIPRLGCVCACACTCACGFLICICVGVSDTARVRGVVGDNAAVRGVAPENERERDIEMEGGLTSGGGGGDGTDYTT